MELVRVPRPVVMNEGCDKPRVGSDQTFSAAAKPLEIALLLGGRAPDDADLRLVAAIRREPHLRLRSLLSLSDDAGRGKTVSGIAGLALSVETSLRGHRKGAARKPDEDVLAGIETVTAPSAPGEATGSCRSLAGLDLILDLGGRDEIPTVLAGASRFGVWSLHYRDAHRLQSPTPGFWEVAHGHGVTGVSLLALGAQRGDAGIIAIARYPTRTSWLGNLDAIRLRAVDLVLRELARLDRDRRLPVALPPAVAEVSLPAPGILDVARYARRPAGALCRQGRVAVAACLGMPTARWSLFVGRGRYDRVSWADCTESKAPPGQYWADPFLFRLPGSERQHVFFEAFEMATGRGNISVGQIIGDRIVEPRVAIATDYHLSYPFVFAHGGDIWMIPESHQAKRLELWRCIDFPTRWTLEKTVMEGESIADSTLCCWGGQWWLFTNQAIAGMDDHNCALAVYRIDSPLMNIIEPHRGNPVVLDATRARNGGRIHVQDGYLMRPAQNNSYRYGYGLSVRRITTLTLDAYAEEQAWSICPDFLPGLSACHHLDTDGETFVFDVRRDVG